MASVLLLAAGCGGKAPAARVAPDFTLATLQGPSLTLSSSRGKVVIVDFWATWCQPCHEAIPILDRLHREYADRGLAVIGVNVDEDGSLVKPFVDRARMTYPVALDADMAVMRSFKARGLPNMYLLDRQGRIRKHWVGLDGAVERAMENEIKSLLEEKA